MLLALIHWLADSTSLGWLRVFNYLTLRAVLAALTAFFIALALGPAVIRELRKLKVGPSGYPRFCGWISATALFGWCCL